jgi:hypothetical protein
MVGSSSSEVSDSVGPTGSPTESGDQVRREEKKAGCPLRRGRGNILGRSIAKDALETIRLDKEEGSR